MEDYVKKNYPNFPYPQPVECLNLLLRKEFGKQIVAGTKKVEWRDFSEHYYNRLIDKKLLDFLVNHKNDEKLLELYPTAIRPVKKIHFHNYNETWWIDVKVKENNIVQTTDAGIKILHEKYGIYDVDDENEKAKKDGNDWFPIYFFFILEEIIYKHNI